MKFEDLDVPSACWLVFLLSFFQSCDDLLFSNNVNGWCYSQLRKEISKDKNVTVIVPLVRFFSNLSSDELILGFLSDTDFPPMLKQLLNSPYQPICKETLLLVSNIVNNQNPKIQSLFNLNFRDVLEQDISKVLPLFE